MSRYNPVTAYYRRQGRKISQMPSEELLQFHESFDGMVDDADQDATAFALTKTYGRLRAATRDEVLRRMKAGAGK